MISTENRVHPRVDLLAQVQVSRDSDVYIMSTANISLGGVFIQGNPVDYPDLRAGVAVDLVIFSTEELGIEDVELRATVVRIVREPSGGGSSPGFGLKFVKLDDEQTVTLNRLIRVTSV